MQAVSFFPANERNIYDLRLPMEAFFAGPFINRKVKIPNGTATAH
jgi:hypothetical protein